MVSPSFDEAPALPNGTTMRGPVEVARGIIDRGRQKRTVAFEDSYASSAGSKPDSREFATFMRAYQDMVFATAARLTGSLAQAEDISQDVFLKAYENFDRLRASPAVGGWLKTVATNFALKHLTRYRRRWRLFCEVFTGAGGAGDLESAATTFDAAAHELDAARRHALIEGALRGLPDRQRIPLVLFHFEEMSYRAIAVRLGHSLAKVKTDILRGRLAMARSLAQSTFEFIEQGRHHRRRADRSMDAASRSYGELPMTGQPPEKVSERANR